MESIRGYFKALKWRSLIVAFSAILLGLLFILTPQASADVICYVAGILLLASGIAAVISYLASGRLFGSYALVSGIVLLVCARRSPSDHDPRCDLQGTLSCAVTLPSLI